MQSKLEELRQEINKIKDAVHNLETELRDKTPEFVTQVFGRSVEYTAEYVSDLFRNDHCDKEGVERLFFDTDSAMFVFVRRGRFHYGELHKGHFRLLCKGDHLDIWCLLPALVHYKCSTDMVTGVLAYALNHVERGCTSCNDYLNRRNA
jgi:hypothetical protein